MTEPEQPVKAECNDEPKLTAEEWAYVEAMSADETTTNGGE